MVTMITITMNISWAYSQDLARARFRNRGDAGSTLGPAAVLFTAAVIRECYHGYASRSDTV